jgi:hypothetical protein
MAADQDHAAYVEEKFSEELRKHLLIAKARNVELTSAIDALLVEKKAMRRQITKLTWIARGALGQKKLDKMIDEPVDLGYEEDPRNTTREKLLSHFPITQESDHSLGDPEPPPLEEIPAPGRVLPVEVIKASIPPAIEWMQNSLDAFGMKGSTATRTGLWKIFPEPTPAEQDDLGKSTVIKMKLDEGFPQ